MPAVHDSWRTIGHDKAAAVRTKEETSARSDEADSNNIQV